MSSFSTQGEAIATSGAALTVVDLLESDLGVLRQALLRFATQHEGFRLLRGSHRRMMLGIHHVRHSIESKRRPGDAACFVKDEAGSEGRQ
jgi:hypothetical protein